MEKLVYYVCGIWFWLTRKRRASRYSEVAETLKDARLYLVSDYTTRASTKDRGGLLPDQLEAITILDEQVAHAAEMSRRFESITGCYHLVEEELAEQAAA